ncbi:copper-transporting ATPase [Desulfosarcina widdelii]|uniref:Copper-transporting ATPase n=1 Tax=Desulfosarcina widdelii TaxID=947919 RepID=A0A5K7Z648_9BACT|nr:cation-translocating P-type ATPase [Desulfosarcina widdelii]BBO77266.1 copper-transporting ATPase [Desulfosarcina widdelii]
MTPANCDLCGLPLRYATVHQTIQGRPLKFCCQGCSMVYTMLLESAEINDPARFKESDLYRQCVAAGVIPADEEDLKRIHREKPSTPSTAADSGRDEQNGTETLAFNLTVEGMWCTACAWVIEKTVAGLDGVEEAHCHFSTDRLHCRYRPDRVAPDQIHRALSRLGYQSREAGSTDADRTGLRRELTRLIVTGLLSANVMMLSWALYAGFFTDLPADAVSKISFPIVAMALVVFVYGGGPMLRKAWFGLIHRSPGMETLVGLAAGCAFVYSLINWLSGSIHLYFDTACMLITLVLLGKFLEQQARGRVRRDLDAFFALQPAKVRLIADAWPQGKYVAIGQLSDGDRFAVEDDEILPADGRVESGKAELDESSLTGEPRPVRVSEGDTVKSGTRVIAGRIVATAETVGTDTVLGRMIAIMSRSLEQKSRFEGRTDRMLRWFVPIVVGLACSTGLACLAVGMPAEQAMVRAVTVMVISCPCALGVAIPMARLAGISLAGRKGILVREIEAFERAGTIDSIVFDKTGTLTRGRWQASGIRCRPGCEEEAIVSLAAGLEQNYDHEIARAIKADAQKKGIEPAAVVDTAIFPEGVQGRTGEKVLCIGTRAFAWKDAFPENIPDDISDELAQGAPTSRVFFSIDGRPAAILFFGDAVRPSVPALVADLKHKIADLHLISGDGDAATREVACFVDMPHARGGLMPADKADYVKALIDSGQQVAMVGDGVNDAAAMARSHLAVAVQSGLGLAKEAAHVTLMRGDPAQLLDFFPLSHQVNAKVAQNLWCAWIYNLISIPVAMSGLLTPLVAATAMLLSSLTVIGNTLLLVRRDGSDP